jgi:hypothetical protein
LFIYTSACLTAPSLFEVAEPHVRIKSGRGAIKAAIIDLRAILLELEEAMVYAEGVVIAEYMRALDDLVSVLLESVEQIVYNRDHLSERAMTASHSIAFSTPRRPVKRLKQ